MKKKPAKAKKVSVPKIKLKQGRYAAILTLRILPEEIERYDTLLKFFNRKNYSEVVNLAVDKVVKLDEELKGTQRKLQEAVQRSSGLNRRVRDYFNANDALREFIASEEDSKSSKRLGLNDDEDDPSKQYCGNCGQYFIGDEDDDCPDCD
jgi:rubrerythrin